MSDALSILQRIRHYRKQGAEHAFMEAERAREAQEARVSEIENAVAASRDEDQDSDEAVWVAQAATWRMKMEVRLRGEKGRLEERTQKVTDRQHELVRASREHRVVERIIEINDERRTLEERRKEARKLDAMGSQRWKRKGVS
jgi:hypothetical protein